MTASNRLLNFVARLLLLVFAGMLAWAGVVTGAEILYALAIVVGVPAFMRWS